MWNVVQNGSKHRYNMRIFFANNDLTLKTQENCTPWGIFLFWWCVNQNLNRRQHVKATVTKSLSPGYRVLSLLGFASAMKKKAKQMLLRDISFA